MNWDGLAVDQRAAQLVIHPRRNGQRDIAVGDHNAKRLAPAAHFEYRRHLAASGAASPTGWPKRSGQRSRAQPRMPTGKKTTMTTINSPSAMRCQPSKYVQNSSLVRWKITAPSTGPHSAPLPPSIAISTIHTPNVAPAKATSRGSTKPIRLPTGPPVSPRKNALMHHAVVL